jgi:hypothetical protein
MYKATGRLTAPSASNALDIGGIEMRLGQEVIDALNALSAAAYSARHTENDVWFVNHKVDGDYEALGLFWAKNGKITDIEKHYTVNNAGEILSSTPRPCATSSAAVDPHVAPGMKIPSTTTSSTAFTRPADRTR